MRRLAVMKRAPIVIAGTLVGLIGVLKFHTAPISLASPAGSALPAASASGASPAAGSGSKQSGGTHTAVGPAVYYDYGTLSVRVTVSGQSGQSRSFFPFPWRTTWAGLSKRKSVVTTSRASWTRAPVL